MKVFAESKINLYLEVLGRDKNGYHRLRTVFQAVKLCDEITMTAAKVGNLEVSCYDGRNNIIEALSGKKNIVYGAASLLREQNGIDRGIKIRIRKNIPVAAGMGGGSSDAAAVLLGLNKLWKLGKGREELVSIARQLGSDVPFFLYGYTALGEGYGDRISPLPRMRKKWVLLVRPRFKVKTKEVYSKFNKKIERIRAISVNRIEKLVREDTGKLLFNRLEEITVRRHPVIARIKEFLIDGGADFSMMSGSGPVVFAFVKNEKTGIKLKYEFEKMFNYPSWLVTTC